MSTFGEIKELPEKLRKYRDKIVELFRQHNIISVRSLTTNYKDNSKFKDEWKRIWVKITTEEGGKLSLTTIGLIIGSALGGVGVAAMGSAVGVPLAFVLGLGGFLSGSKFDSLKMFGSNKNVSVSIQKNLYAKIALDAKTAEITVRALIEQIIQQAYEESI